MAGCRAILRAEDKTGLTEGLVLTKSHRRCARPVKKPKGSWEDAEDLNIQK